MTEQSDEAAIVEFVLLVDEINKLENLDYANYTRISGAEQSLIRKIGFNYKNKIMKIAQTLLMTGAIDELPQRGISNYFY